MSAPYQTIVDLKENLEELQALNADLLAALKHARLFVSQPTPLSAEIDALITKAEGK
jgi:hypothetical protein